MNGVELELVRRFMRVRPAGTGSALDVAVVEWRGPHTPELCWTTLRTWKRPPTATRIEVAQSRTLQATRFFTVRLVARGALMGIEVVDHIIVGEQRYFSYREAGWSACLGRP